MRLIDADEILLNDESEYTKTMLEVDDTVKTIITAVHNNIQTLIQEAPTIDAVPVKHGHWIEKEYKYGGLMAEKMFCICSVCGEEQIQKLDDKFEQFMTPYCANCGAKMDEGEKNGLDRRRPNQI